MARVYFKEISSYTDTLKINNASSELFDKLVTDEKITLESTIPLKVHFGEEGNVTFIEPKDYEGIILNLKGRGIKGAFIETNALYKGGRTTKAEHMALARRHGFTMLPILIADGETGLDHVEVEIDKKHFRKCKVAKGIYEQKQIIFISHFKGHILAGFGGAIKNLGMGCSSRGGKLDQHAKSIPLLDSSLCKQCRICVNQCPADAITIGLKSYVDSAKCIGCATCIAVCPYGAMMINWGSTAPAIFIEKVSEYAFAAQKGKNNIYLNYALRITGECDCMGHKMAPITRDLGIFASTDPVAVDKACLDMLTRREGKALFRGKEIFEYAEKIGLGKRDYSLVKVS